jgi:hypothetical protein
MLAEWSAVVFILLADPTRVSHPFLPVIISLSFPSLILGISGQKLTGN